MVIVYCSAGSLLSIVGSVISEATADKTDELSARMVAASDKLPSPDSMSVHSFVYTPSLSTQIITFTINGYIFKIPRNYLITAVINNSDGALLYILTRTPDFKGYDTDTKTEYDERNPDIVDRQIDIYTFSEGKTAYSGNSADLNLPGLKFEKPDANGLVLAKHSISAAAFNVYVHFEKDQSQSTVISCFKEDVDKCDVYQDTPQHIVLLFEFNKKMLGNWKQIKAGVLKLFNSFCVGEVQ